MEEKARWKAGLLGARGRNQKRSGFTARCKPIGPMAYALAYASLHRDWIDEKHLLACATLVDWGANPQGYKAAGIVKSARMVRGQGTPQSDAQ